MMMSAMLVTTALCARDIYVYNGSSITPIGTSQNVQKIAFDSNGMSITTQSGSVTTFSLANFDYFTFFNRSVTGIKQSQKDLFGISYNGTTMSIRSEKVITKVTVFNAAGTEILSFAPKAKFVTRNIASLPAGVYLIKVVADDDVFTQKIIK